MMLEIYSVYDNKAQAFLQPFFQANNAVAVRSVTQAVNDKTTDFHRWPSDFGLFHIGRFSDSIGTIEGFEVPENLGLLSNFLQE
jgi:hypothetical protein